MLKQTLVIARKEILDHVREVRSLLASVMHLLMGPVIISLVLFSIKNASHVIGSMAVIFLLVSAFTGGMNIAMDIIAGERERRSLLPLLLNPVSRASVVVGKWLAISIFAIGGVILTFAAFAIPFGIAAIPLPSLTHAALVLLPLAALAAALQLTISTFCRTAKEAQTYLSLLVFVPMGISMFIVFLAPSFATWMHLTPVLPTLLVAIIWCTALCLKYSTTLLTRDEIVYGR